MKLIFLFIDGVGIREPATDNPVNSEVCPTLCSLLSRHCRPIDACLGVEGLPQSATGQATMMTGVNCAEAMGHHCEGFPGPSLRAIVEANNLFLELKRRGKSVCFADAYLIDRAEDLQAARFKSVTTVMALTTPEVVRIADDLADNRALMQDLTRETIQDRYPDIAVIPPQRAAEHLITLANEHDFTFFEFFQTDVSGHSMEYARACAVLRVYDNFLRALCRMALRHQITIAITSDHGNIENMSERGHTRNPVPFAVYGPGEAELRSRVESLRDVTPALLSFFDK